MGFEFNPVDEDEHGLCRYEIEQLREKLSDIRKRLESIVVTAGCDRGVVLLSQDGPTHYDSVHKCQVYDHENFSPLGDALIELYEMTTLGDPERCNQCGDALTGHEDDGPQICRWCVMSTPTPEGSSNQAGTDQE